MRTLKNWPNGGNTLQRKIIAHIKGMYELAALNDEQFCLSGEQAPVAQVVSQIQSIIHTLGLNKPPCERRLRQQVTDAMRNIAKLNCGFTCRLPKTSRDQSTVSAFSLEQMLRDHGYPTGDSTESAAVAQLLEAA